MASGDLIPSNHDRSEPASTEVQFALVIARMIDSVKNSPEHMRQAVYDLARYKLQEQFIYADAKDIRRTKQALETAIEVSKSSQSSRSAFLLRHYLRKSATPMFRRRHLAYPLLRN